MIYRIALSALFLLFTVVNVTGQFEERNVSIETHTEAYDTLPIFFNHTIPKCPNNDTIYSSRIVMYSDNNYPFSGQGWPGCGRWAIHYPLWMSFVANGYEVSLDIGISDCSHHFGTQIAVYELPMDVPYNPDSFGMNPEYLAHDIVSDCMYAGCNLGTFEFTIETVPGNFYGIVLDGCNGDDCVVDLTVVTDSTQFAVDSIQPDSIYYPQNVFDYRRDTLCTGATNVPFYIDYINNADRILWTFNDSLIQDTLSFNTLYFDFPDTGTYDICVAAANGCDTSDFHCRTIEVVDLDTIITYDTICQGEDYTWISPFDEVMGQYGPFINETGDFEYDTSTINQFKCDLPMKLYLHVKNENDEQPTEIDTFTCVNDLPFFIGNEEIDEPVSSYLVESISPLTGCDTFFSLDLTVFGGMYDIITSCDGQQNITFSFDPINQSHHTKWEDQLDIFTDTNKFSFQAIWLVNSTVMKNGQDMKFTISEEDLDSIATGDNAIIALHLMMYYDSTFICNSTSPLIVYELSNKLPVFDFDINIVNDSLLMVADSMSTYQWLNCDSNDLPIQGAESQFFKPSNEGNYAVILYKDGCVDTSDCIYFSNTTSTTYQNREALKIAPNPTNGQFRIVQLPDHLQGAQYSIYSFGGKMVQSGYIKTHTVIDVNNLSSGIYYLKAGSSIVKIAKM